MVGEAVAVEEHSGGQSVWQRLAEAIDVASFRPRLRENMVSREFTSSQGQTYFIVQNPSTATYLRLDPEDFYIYSQMDGTRTVQELVVAYMLKYQRFSLQRVLQLVEDLRYGHFLTDPPYPTYGMLRRRTRRRSLATLLDTYGRLFLNREFPISGLDGVLERAYRGGVWVLFTRPVQILLLLLAIIGVPLFLWPLVTQPTSVQVGETLTRDLPLYLVFFMIVAAIHELSHAFAVKSFGRVVRRGGVSLFYGFPSLFVDTQDIWMEHRHARMATSWAGPYSGLILTGAAGIVLTIAPDASWSPAVRLFGLVALINNVFQLMPLIQLDGYFILMDWLEIPQLRRRALSFVRNDLLAKIRRRQGFNREERIFAVFGVLSATYTCYAIFLGTSFWWNNAHDVVEGALHVPSLSSLLALVLVSALVVGFLIGLGRRVIDMGRDVVRGVRRASGIARERWHRERLEFLSRVPVLEALGPERAEVLASHLREERFAPGAAIVRQGDRGDRFYLIADGRADVIVEGPQGGQVVATLGALDYFGERALTQEAPRSATVRAQTPLRAFSLKKQDFQRSIAQYVASDVALHARLGEREELDRFDLFASLTPRERDLLLLQLRSQHFPAGSVIVRQGEPGRNLYCIRSGSVEVVRDDVDGETLLQTLGPGQFFGEIALLLDVPRSATVRAAEEASLWVLGKQDFADLLGHYFNLRSEFAHVARRRLPSQQILVEANQRNDSVEATVGHQAPDFEMEALQGDTRSLAQFRGKGLLLYFSRGVRSHAAQSYIAQLREAEGRLRSAGIQPIVIVPDTPEEARASLPNFPGSLPVLSDSERTVYCRYHLFELQPFGAEHEILSPTLEPGSWLATLSERMEEQASGAMVGLLQESLFLVDGDGQIRARVVGGSTGSLPAPEDFVMSVPATAA